MTAHERLVELRFRKPIREVLAEMVENGLTLIEMGDRCEVSFQTIRVWLRKYGFARRQAGRRAMR